MRTLILVIVCALRRKTYLCLSHFNNSKDQQKEKMVRGENKVLVGTKDVNE